MSDEPIHKQLRAQAEREGLLEPEATENSDAVEPAAEAAPSFLSPGLLIAVVALDALGVLALVTAHPLLAVALFVASGALLTVRALAASRETASQAEEEKRREALARGEIEDE
jgi:choline-glycine betaine transporter